MKTFQFSAIACFALVAIALAPGNVDAEMVHWLSTDGGNDHSYMVINDRTETWSGMKSYAESLSFNGAQGYLATVTTSAENQFLLDEIGAFAISSAAIGLTDELVEGQWQWITGEAFSYTNWNPGEPNNAGGIEDYAFYASGATGRWNDFVDTVSTTRMIVEFNAVPTPEPSSLILLLGGFTAALLSRDKVKRSV